MLLEHRKLSTHLTAGFGSGSAQQFASQYSFAPKDSLVRLKSTDAEESFELNKENQVEVVNKPE